jgi:TPR repeat protein
MNRDGDVAACQQADPDAPKPPSSCSSILRVTLVAVGGESGASTPAVSCPQGMVAMNGKCTVNTDAATKKCNGGDVASCEASCKANIVESCDRWGNLMIAKAESSNSTMYDGPMADAFRRACDLGNEVNCAMLAINYAAGRGVATDGAKALALASKACLEGAPVGCTVLGGMYDKGKGVPADPGRGTKYYERACNAGDGLGCVAAAQAYGGGRGVTVDRVKMADYYDRACDAQEAWGCVGAGKAYEAGDGVQPSPVMAIAFYQRGCNQKNADACTAVKRLRPAAAP